MKGKTTLLALAVLCCVSGVATLARADDAAGPPNIILILTDDQGWADLSESPDPAVSIPGATFVHTPNMDRLAREGMRFTSGYSPAPICTPSRRSIQFGMTPARQRGTEFIGDFHPKGHPSIAQAIKQADSRYRCAHFGKWGEVMSGRNYADKHMEANPAGVGYDETDGVTDNAEGTFYHQVYQAADYRRNWTCDPDADPKRTFSVTDRAISFMERQVHDKHPFYVQASYYAIHTAYQATKTTIDKYTGKTSPTQMMSGIAPMLEDLDTGIGKLLAAVDRLGIAANTYVFYTSDNGGERGPGFVPNNNALPPRNHPLRLYKQFLYEGGIRVPFVVRGPGVKAGAVCREPVAQFDLLPTFYDLAGGKNSLPSDIDGGSLRPLLTHEGSGTVKRTIPGLVFHRPMLKDLSHSAMRVGDLKLVVRWANGWQSASRELYDLSKDIGETNDLSALMPQKTDELYGALLSYLKSVDAEVPPATVPRPAPFTLLPAAKAAAAKGGVGAGAGTGGGEFHVPRLTKAPVIDGMLAEWPSIDPQGTMTLASVGGGKATEAWIGYDDTSLYIAARTPVDNVPELRTPRKPPDNFDRLLIAIQDISGAVPGPVLTLLGYPDGKHRNPNFAQAPAATTRALEGAVTYRAEIGSSDWTCEWKISLSALGLHARPDTRARFNMIVKKTPPRPASIWQPTGGAAWDLEKAGVISFQ